MTGTAVDRTAPPPAGGVKAFRFPDYVRARLDNGLTVLAADAGRGPLVEMALLFPAGADRDPRELPGAATLLGGLLDEGTSHRSALDIAATVEEMGGRLVSGADWDVGFLDVEVLSSRVEPALRLLAELATDSTLPADELERQRKRRLAELMRKRSSPSYLAGERFAASVYGGTPYGHTLVGHPEAIEALDRERLLRLYHDRYTLAGAFLVAAGDLEANAFVEQVRQVLGSLPGGEVPQPPSFDAPSIEGVRVEIVDRPSGAQTELRIGHAGVPRSHPDFTALGVMNAVLGGKFTSRINLNLRERHGYTYGAHSTFTSRKGPGPFLVRTAVATPVAGAAAGEVVSELRRMRDEPVTAEELDDAQSYIIGTFPYTLQTTSGLADRLETLALHDLAPDYYDELPQAIRAVTREEVLRVARRHLQPDDLVVVAVGPKEELAGQFDALQS